MLPLLLLATSVAVADAGDPAPTDAPVTAEAPAAAAAAATNDPAAVQAFKERVVLFEDWVGVSASTGQVVSSWTVPRKGIYKEPLNGSKFYEYIGEPDLAKTYRKRSTIRLSLNYGGLAVGAGGLALALATMPNDCEFVGTALYPQAESASEAKAICRRENEKKKPASTLGWVATGVGTGAMVIGLTINPHPLKPHDQRKLADQYNARLAQELGIDLDRL